MKYRFIETCADKYSIEQMCRMLGISRSSYYAWKKREPSKREKENQMLLERIRQIHKQSHKAYGSPRVYAQLRNQGISCTKNRVARMMRADGLKGRRKYRKIITTNSKHEYPIAPNILKRDFQAEKPNQKWVADITYIPTREGWLYLAGVMDLFSRKIVGWDMAGQIDATLVENALRMALYQRQPERGLLHHSDRGSQYASQQIRSILAANQIQVSMSGKGNCYDNAVMESFWGTLKNEWVHYQNYETRSQARNDIFRYVEGFYNTVRLHSSLGYLSPVEFEANYHFHP